MQERVINNLIKLAKDDNKIVAVDSRYQLQNFKDVTIATPNKEETENIVGFTLDSAAAKEKAGWQLKNLLRA